MRALWPLVLAGSAPCLLWLLVLSAGAVPSLPPDLPPAERDRLRPIAEQADVSTHVEARSFVARQDVFEYLLDHPELASHVARALRLARYQVRRTPEGLWLDDGWGVTGYFRVVYASNGTRVSHARGQFKKALLPTIHGEAVTVIAYDATPIGDGRSRFRTWVTGFVRLDSRFLAGLMRLASSVAQRKADLEARRLMKVFAEASTAIDADPAGVLARVSQRPDVPRRELEEFARLLSDR